MIKSIDLRFYTIAEFNTGTCHQLSDIVEITECQFNALVSEGGAIEYERFTMFANGSNHIALTVVMPDFPNAEDLDVIE